jgi:acyl transferase domain-containing protein
VKFKEEIEVVSKTRQEPIAIIGIGCRFPGASGPQAFWKLLHEGSDAIREVPPDRWDVNALYDPDPASPGKTVSRRGGFIENVSHFDWRAFRIPPREAKYMDPQHRLLLEVAWEALEDAGLPLEKVAGSRTGVFMGIMWNDYLKLQSTKLTELNGYSNTGNAFAFAPNRISYTFDLKGPSIAVDCACASSLTSVHYACQSLWLGEADMALAGGVNLMLTPDISIMLSKAGVLSTEGSCKTLDANADGFVRGEGAGVIVLKPFSELTPSDRVYATIRGSAINHNGRNEWIMAASPEGQAMVIRDACRQACITPAELDYVELHGTGLLKGDVIETKALGKVAGKHEARKHSCIIGSVKTNIGHLESAAGIAGIIKVALSLHHRQIPATLHLQKINPDIALEELGLAAQNKIGSWPEKEGLNLAGVTATSMSGVNAHVILEASPRDSESSSQVKQIDAQKTRILPISAHSAEALLKIAQLFRDFLSEEESEAGWSLENICFTAGMRRSHHEYRLALVGHSRQHFIESLEAFLQGQPSDGWFAGRKGAADQGVLEELKHNEVQDELISECIRHRNQEGAVCITLPTEEGQRVSMLKALASVYTRGYTVEWSTLYPEGGLCVELPNYPWQREHLWLDWLDGQKLFANPAHKTPSGEQASERQNEFLNQFRAAPRKQRQSLLMAHLRDQVIKILGLNPSFPLKPQQRLFDAGLDSIATVELVSRLQTSLGLSLPSTLVFEYSTIEALSEYLAQKIPSLESISMSNDGLNNEIDVDPAIDPETVEQLSEDQTEKLLLKKLEAIERSLK